MSSTVAATNRSFAAQSGTRRRAHGAGPRLTAWAEIAALLFIAGALVLATVVTSGRAAANVPSEQVRVESGQTLWTLAAQHPIAGLTTEQTAELIANTNRLGVGKVTAGSTIKIPAHAERSLAVACR